MKTNILENQDFILSVQEQWDSYYEATVKFVKEVSTHGYTYHLFVDEKAEKSYYLKPRFRGHDIEGIFVEKLIIVNISKKISDADQDETQPPIFYATGELRLPNN